jgi:hypothetical protein
MLIFHNPHSPLKSNVHFPQSQSPLENYDHIATNYVHTFIYNQACIKIYNFNIKTIHIPYMYILVYYIYLCCIQFLISNHLDLISSLFTPILQSLPLTHMFMHSTFMIDHLIMKGVHYDEDMPFPMFVSTLLVHVEGVEGL